MSVSVEPIRSARDLHAFVTWPWSLYKGDDRWVPPLIGDTKKLLTPGRSPFFEHGSIDPFLARKDGRIVGRIAAIRNRNHEQFHDESTGFFGFFESEDDPETAGALIERASEGVRGHGLDRIRGPVNPSTNDTCGVLVEGFGDSPYVMMTYNPPYYDRLLRDAGLSGVKDLLAYELTADTVPDRLVRGAALARKRNASVTVRPMNKKNFRDEVDLFRQVYNAAWEKNWGFVPMTDAEVDHMARELKPAVDPGLIRIAEADGKAVGFALGLPDLNLALRHANGRLFPFGLIKLLWHSRRINRARILTLGLIPEYRRSGIDVILYHDIFEYGLSRGYYTGEFSWILEDNVAMMRPLESMGATPKRRYRLYEGPVSR